MRNGREGGGGCKLRACNEREGVGEQGKGEVENEGPDNRKEGEEKKSGVGVWEGD